MLALFWIFDLIKH